MTPGIYTYFSGFKRVELLQTDVDVSDFFVPNGAFRNSSFEWHSLITDNRMQGDATPYMLPAVERPSSETEGGEGLEQIGNILTNLPPRPSAYVHRHGLESEIEAAFVNDRHPIITLVGRGGIGKTSAALSVLHSLSVSSRFDLIIWFSARDIDLSMSGVKAVRPHVLTEHDIAKEYCRLIGYDYKNVGQTPSSVLADHMSNDEYGSKAFVFDNFETARNPIDLFNWIDTNIRLPNKVIITSRFRDFKADYPISVMGMEHNEARQLADQTAVALGVSGILSSDQISEISEEADGHPYIIKILLGEIANDCKYTKPSRLIARKDDVLEALFERTYANLTPLASRAFLVLCSWRSLVPQIALEAALLRHNEEKLDPEAAIDQLIRMSLVERLVAGDNSDFLQVPLTAATFGKSKLEVSPIRASVENDVRFLQDVGATVPSGLKDGLAPKIDALFRKIARKASTEASALEDARPVMEFLAQAHPRAWVMIASIEQEFGNKDEAAEALRRFLASKPLAHQAQVAWRQLMKIYLESGDVIPACDAFLRASALVDPPLSELSYMANCLNNSSEAWSELHISERATIFRPLAKMMEENLIDASATDISRLAWLYLHMGDDDRALQLADEGLRREPENLYCDRLRRKLLAIT